MSWRNKGNKQLHNWTEQDASIERNKKSYLARSRLVMTSR